MAERCVALLRGINVGRAKRVAMADLRALVAELGYGDVETLLNSGNVVFTVPGAARGTAAVAARIERALAERTGVAAKVTVLTARELAAIVDENPLLDVAHDPSRLLVAVLADPADRSRLAPLLEERWEPEALALGTRAAYLWCPDGILATRLWPAIEKRLAAAAAVTSRNWATITKLHERAARPLDTRGRPA